MGVEIATRAIGSGLLRVGERADGGDGTVRIDESVAARTEFGGCEHSDD
eukprot:CAMPEP_0171318412 /NCGR_PEP_ID=MMETSP0816-20121228/88464_1 /TAXON_ID=420281 /ORGANISM="Proboscia inermis, Strain CCAP1064/1" /LENGTH=48 /DNA_ID= /DNA_START= /DNA_END= /DNA_ORIENTATION=